MNLLFQSSEFNLQVAASAPRKPAGPARAVAEPDAFRLQPSGCAPQRFRPKQGGSNSNFQFILSGVFGFQSPIMFCWLSKIQPNVPVGVFTGGTTFLPPSDSALAIAAATSSTCT